MLKICFAKFRASRTFFTWRKTHNWKQRCFGQLKSSADLLCLQLVEEYDKELSSFVVQWHILQWHLSSKKRVTWEFGLSAAVTGRTRQKKHGSVEINTQSDQVLEISVSKKLGFINDNREWIHYDGNSSQNEWTNMWSTRKISPQSKQCTWIFAQTIDLLAHFCAFWIKYVTTFWKHKATSNIAEQKTRENLNGWMNATHLHWKNARPEHCSDVDRTWEFKRHKSSRSDFFAGGEGTFFFSWLSQLRTNYTTQGTVATCLEYENELESLDLQVAFRLWVVFLGRR